MSNMGDQAEIWPTSRLVEMVEVLISAGFDVRVHSYGLRIGEPSDFPWSGPIAWEVGIEGTCGHDDDWAVSVERLVHLEGLLRPFGAVPVVTRFPREEGQVVLRLERHRQSRFLTERPA